MSTVLECEAILFDLDGVLIDSTDNVEYHWKQWAAERELDENEVISIVHGRRAVEVIETMAPELDAEEEAGRLAHREARDTRGIERIDGARELLASCPDGHWAVVTSGTELVARARLCATGIPDPPLLITADDVSEGKPEPTPYLKAAEELGIPAEDCLVIEDTPRGVDAAHAAGMCVIAVTTSHNEQEVSEADAVVERLAQIAIESGSGEEWTIRITVDN